jgi:uncharacterized repeat protein (TIGR03803 family)
MKTTHIQRSFSVPLVIVILAICLLPSIAVSATTGNYTTLVTFNGPDGSWPAYESLVQGLDGSFYGTTNEGGAYGAGTVFKISPSGTLTTLHSFCAQNCTDDGSRPTGGLMLGTDRNFYGTTDVGGTYDSGTIYKITLKGTLTILYSFCSQPNCADGGNPLSGLVQARNGNLYGTTGYGGANTKFCNGGCGTMFEITPAGKFTTLYSFCSQPNCTDGGFPNGELIQGSNGNFYGVTQQGGVNTGQVECENALPGCGTVFELTPSGQLTTLYNFCSQANCGDGALPFAGLVQATNGDFYGTTFVGGNPPPNAYGTVFKITPGGILTILRGFDTTDGGLPVANLIQATNGDLYGTTYRAGNGWGTIFQITVGGAFTRLYDFDFAEGDCEGGLVQGTDGSFYGTTFGVDGQSPLGTVFNLSLGLHPFVKTLPSAGKVGTTVVILGNNLDGTMSVVFNGTPATFTVLGPSAIQTTVPTGATSGVIEVKTPTKSLESNISFDIQ